MIDKSDKLIYNRNLTVKDKFDNILLSNVSIDVYKGEFIGIVGESGSGKSLTVKSILGLLPQDLKVEVEYDEVLGYSINRLNDRQKENLLEKKLDMFLKGWRSFQAFTRHRSLTTLQGNLTHI